MRQFTFFLAPHNHYSLLNFCFMREREAMKKNRKHHSTVDAILGQKSVKMHAYIAR